MTARRQAAVLALGNIAIVAICFALLAWGLTCVG